MLDPSCVWAQARVLDLRWRMCVYSASIDRYVSASILSGGAWEGDLVVEMIRTMRAHPGAVLLDIGSNVGFYTLAAAKAGFTVHAFEPVPQNAARIEASLHENRARNVSLYTAALTDATGIVPMGRSRDNQGGVAHKGRKGTARPHARTRVDLMMPALRLDDILGPETTSPLYLKIDIEGGECAAFDGMRTYLQGARRIVGVNMEFGQSRTRCCSQWVATGGPFDVFHRKHSLCPRGTTYDNVCNHNAWDIVWAPCTGVNGNVAG